MGSRKILVQSYVCFLTTHRSRTIANSNIQTLPGKAHFDAHFPSGFQYVHPSGPRDRVERARERVREFSDRVTACQAGERRDKYVNIARVRIQILNTPRPIVVASRNSLQAELTAISNSRSATSTEAELLKQRVDDTEREKRDLVAVISRLKEDASQREGLHKETPFLSTAHSDRAHRRDPYSAGKSQAGASGLSNPGEPASGAAFDRNIK